MITNSRQKISNFIADVLFPKSCYVCGRGDTYLCVECGKGFVLNELKCPHCSIRIPFGKMQSTCKKILKIDYLYISLDYSEDVIKRMVMDFKYNNCFALAEDLVKASLDYLNENKLLKKINKDKTIIVPVPSHISKVRKRDLTLLRR